MSRYLSNALRNQLAKTVQKARLVGEEGARQAIRMLTVDNHKPHRSMSSAERVLRRRLRAHGRQLGDRRDPRTGAQEIRRLSHEVAYEHWHRMLFARFLAENQLLIEPESGVAISLDECDELAREREQDRWTLAGSFAERMLPRIFRPDAPALKVKLTPEIRQALERLVDSLPTEVFASTDSMGWVYQFWQSEKKNEVNRSGIKIGADELSAVTQLFTEPYMVSFLLDNGLGAWWAARRLRDSDLRAAGSEIELRHKAAVPGVPLDYLRFVRYEDTRGTARWHFASRSFDGWPEDLGELRILDPCCGSGHFLVAAFSMLVPMRMELEDLTPQAAVDAVLQENLHGLELDPRCVELAAFSLALAAWTYPGAGGFRPLPELNLACSGLAPNATKEQWLTLAKPAAAVGGMPARRNLLALRDSLLSVPLRNSLDTLYELFAQAPILGSLINPHAVRPNLFESDFESVRSLLAATLKYELTNDEQAERAVAAQGMAQAAELLFQRYHWVITNVPYLGRDKQNETLRAYCAQRQPNAKNDLATVFLERCLELCTEGGAAGLVLPQNWLFLTSYRMLRERLLKTEAWHLLARLGPGAFETISGEVVKAILINVTHGKSIRHPNALLNETGVTGTIHCLDVSEFRTAGEKATQLRDMAIVGVKQADQLRNPGSAVVCSNVERFPAINQFANVNYGSKPGQTVRVTRAFWEIFSVNQALWRLMESSPTVESHYSGKAKICFSQREIERQTIVEFGIRGSAAWGKSGVIFSKMSRLLSAIYVGNFYDDNTYTIIPKDPEDGPAIFTFVESGQFSSYLRKINQKLNVTRGLVAQVPLDLDHWTGVAREKYPNGLPCPYSDDPTQWIFHGHPCGSVVWDETEKRTAQGPIRTDPTVLQIAVARLLGYHWPAEQDANMELAAEQREWVRRCSALATCADKDGIVCVPSVRGESPAWERLLRLLSTSYGDSWNDAVLGTLLSAAGSPNLDAWLRDRFFIQHCKLFRQRPFIWHVWDGRRRDGFHALVNYHNLAEDDGKGRRCLASLTYSYLGDWINRQRDGVKRGEGGAEGRLVAALELQKRLVSILDGDPPFDIFVRWKSVDQQSIGWEPDINDGVRLNIRPFMSEDLPGGRKGAGILRTKPNIHWRKDRGKEPFREKESFPWFWNCPGDGTCTERTDFKGRGDFDGNRWNDLHYTNAAKTTARARRVAEAAIS